MRKLVIGCGTATYGNFGSPCISDRYCAVDSNGVVMIGTAGTPAFSNKMASNTLPDEQLPQSPIAEMAAIAASAAGAASAGSPP